MESLNPYTTPTSNISNVESLEEIDIKVWSFRGRLGRVRYLAYLMALLFIVWFGGGVLAAMLIPTFIEQSPSVMRVAGLVMLSAIYGVLLVGSFSFAIRRIRDFNASGWWSLLLLIPLVNVIFGFALWFIPGTDGSNRFGAKTPRNGIGVSILAALAPLMLVAYIGIITAIAIPQYQEYAKRAHEMAQTAEP